jgi:hypothetical protein
MAFFVGSPDSARYDGSRRGDAAMSDLSLLHPTTDQLTAISRGLLDDRDSSTVEEHVAGCDACRGLLEALPEPPLAARVRQAGAVHRAGRTPTRA